MFSFNSLNSTDSSLSSPDSISLRTICVFLADVNSNLCVFSFLLLETNAELIVTQVSSSTSSRKVLAGPSAFHNF